MDVDECTRLLSEGKRLYNDGETTYNDGKELELIKYEAEKFADNITDRLTRVRSQFGLCKRLCLEPHFRQVGFIH